MTETIYPENVLRLLETAVAPVKLSDDFCAKFKMYDNSGIIINCGKPVVGATFSLDLSEAAAEAAIKAGHNLIVTHHPAIYGGVSRFDLKNDSHARALALCIKHDISVISMHLNFDAAPEGIDYYLMRGLGGSNAKILAQIEGGGYGRFYEIAPVTIQKLLDGICKEFSTKRAVCHGSVAGEIKRFASFCGAGCDDAAIAFARENNADVLVSSDMPHHRLTELVENGIAVIQLTHYSAENYGFNKIYQNIKTRLQIPSSYYFDERFA
ncbi:MAG: Nif3-like dinuclear metal center hexameric protein [Clostridia bacterium]|nr:Nif3-like dinuclear metal center hexameric protein [Clostridia bacterium]